MIRNRSNHNKTKLYAAFLDAEVARTKLEMNLDGTILIGRGLNNWLLACAFLVQSKKVKTPVRKSERGIVWHVSFVRLE